jgi:alpha-tubulin suppressor-like RCC1 family protein
VRAACCRWLLACSLFVFVGVVDADAGRVARAAPAAPATSVAAIAGGGYAGYELLANGRVWAWGDDLEGQVGTGGNWRLSATPVEIHGLANIVAIAGGQNTAYALARSGAVWAWGDDSQAELGVGPTSPRETPQRIDVPRGIVAIAAGGFSAYALRAGGSVWAWGANAWGQLGSAGVFARGEPARVQRLGDVIAIAAGLSNGYALRRDGTVWAWGEGILGQLGQGCGASAQASARCQASSVPVRVRGLSDVVAIAAGAFTVYALRGDGTVWAWGDNEFGALGSGSGRAIAGLPVRVSGLQQVAAIAAGAYDGYALRRDGSAWSWGLGADGELGDGGNRDHSTPTRVLQLGAVAKLAAGGQAAYALDRSGRLWAWGSDVYGQLGDNSQVDLNEPTRVLQPPAVTELAGRRTP